jgi:hypothetical protein
LAGASAVAQNFPLGAIRVGVHAFPAWRRLSGVSKAPGGVVWRVCVVGLLLCGLLAFDGREAALAYFGDACECAYAFRVAFGIRR